MVLYVPPDKREELRERMATDPERDPRSDSVAGYLNTARGEKPVHIGDPPPGVPTRGLEAVACRGAAQSRLNAAELRKQLTEAVERLLHEQEGETRAGERYKQAADRLEAARARVDELIKGVGA